MRATWLPGQNQRPHDGHQVSGQPERVIRAGTSPIASNDERDWSATLQPGQRHPQHPDRARGARPPRREREHRPALRGGHGEQLLEPGAAVGGHVVAQEAQPARQLLERGVRHEPGRLSQRPLPCAPKIADGAKIKGLRDFRPRKARRLRGRNVPSAIFGAPYIR